MTDWFVPALILIMIAVALHGCEKEPPPPNTLGVVQYPCKPYCVEIRQ